MIYSAAILSAKSLEDLLNDLKSNDANIRYQAALDLGKLGDRNAILPLMEAMEDKDKYVRYWAVSSLGDLKATEAVPALIEKLKDEDELMRYWAAIALGRIGDTTAIKPVDDAYRIEKILNTKIGMEIALDKLNWMKKQTESAMATPVPDFSPIPSPAPPYDNGTYIPSETVTPVPTLQVATQKPELQIPADVAGAIAGLDDEDPLIRKGAAFSLGKFGSKSATGALMETLSAEDNRDVQIEIINSLGKLSARESIDILSQFAMSQDEAIRIAVAGAFKEIRDPVSLPSIIKLLTDSNPSVRKIATDTIGIMKDKQSISYIIPLLKDNDIFVVQSAITALTKMNSHEAVPEFIILLKSQNKEIAQSAAFALGKSGDITAVEPLIEALNDSHDGLRAGAVFALGKLGDKRALQPIILALKDKYWNVRYWAVTALGELKDTSAIEPLMAAYQVEPDPDIKKSMEETIKALSKIIK
jgi:HEAT repeat protein